LCAAPGGKLAEMMGDQGEVVAVEVAPCSRTLARGIERLGLHSISCTSPTVPRRICSFWAGRSHDRAIVDAPVRVRLIAPRGMRAEASSFAELAALRAVCCAPPLRSCVRGSGLQCLLVRAGRPTR
jgi:hypothetical protein